MGDRETFAQCRIWRSMAPELIEQLFAIGESTSYRDGDTLFRHGDVGDAMYVIVEGTVELRFPEALTVKLLSAGAFFGELSLFSRDGTRTATAVARGNVRAHALHRRAVDSLEQTRPQLVVRLLRLAVNYLLESESGLITELRGRNQEVARTLDYLRRTEEQLGAQELLARTDGLTGVYNRRCFDIYLERLATGPSEDSHRRELGLVLVDVDHFKVINDTHGHSVGDLLLKWVADQIRAAVRKTDLPCRIGGDEFAVLLPALRAEEGKIVSHRLLKQIVGAQLTVPSTGEQLTPSVSAGGAALLVPCVGTDLYESADRCLYQAKDHGRGCVSWMGEIL